MIFLANPSARSGRGKEKWSFWAAELKERGVGSHWHECASGDDCRRQARQADQPVVAVGGDGTINNVISGLMASAAPPAMGVLYAGTSPDFCKFHRIPIDPKAALATVLAFKTKMIDVAEICFTGSGSTRQSGFFASSCNIGLGSATACFANKWRKYLGDLCGTGLGLIKAMLTHRPFKSTLTVDGRPLIFDGTNHIIVLKNPHIASSLRLNLDCRADDGYLQVVVIHNQSGWGLLRIMGSLYRGSLLQQRGVFVQRCRSLGIMTSPPQNLEFDGDPQGRTPAEIKINAQALALICGGNHEGS